MNLSDRIRQRGATLAVLVSDAIRNGNRKDARLAIREAGEGERMVAIGRMLESVDGLPTSDICRFLDSFADN